VGTSALFVWLISHQPTVLFSQNKAAITTQPAVLFSQNKPVITTQPAVLFSPNKPAPAINLYSFCRLALRLPYACFVQLFPFYLPLPGSAARIIKQ
jgi:hypothetical protein